MGSGDAARAAILQVLSTFGALTDERLWDMYESNRSSGHAGYPRVSASGLRSRRAELVRMGKVEARGRERIRSGRSAIVWGVCQS